MSEEGRLATKSIVDTARRALWVPIWTPESTGPDNCNFFGCRFEVGTSRAAWLYRVSIDTLFQNFGARVLAIQSPTTISSGTVFHVQITSNLTGSLDLPKSYLRVIVNDATTAACSNPSCQWSQQCTGGICTYTATVPGSVTLGTTGALAWHAYLASFSPQAQAQSLHSVGRTVITP